MSFAGRREKRVPRGTSWQCVVVNRLRIFIEVVCFLAALQTIYF